MRPVLLVTSHVPPDRVPAFAALDEREDVELALFGGQLRHGVGGGEPTAYRSIEQRATLALAASGRYRAVVAGLNGRLALPAAYLGARRAGVPFVLWASLWAHPRTAAHVLSRPVTDALYARADAVVAYGPHVERYVRLHGARNVHVAPQAVDPTFWSAPAESPRRLAPFQVAFVGRDAPEKGVAVLERAWEHARFESPQAGLVLVGVAPRAAGAPGIHPVGAQPPPEVRNFLAGSDVAVLPSLRTATFREPWGLAVNEAMHMGLPVIASTEVGAAAGGLVRHERSGLIVRAGDHAALSAALLRLREDAGLRRRLGAQAARDVGSYTPRAWAAGVSAALRSVGASRAP